MALVLNGTTGTSMVQDDAVNPVTDIASGIPCCRVGASAQLAISNEVWTKSLLNTKEFDTTNAYNTTTYRFVPLVAGYYNVSTSCVISSATASVITSLTNIRKNGTSIIGASSGQYGGTAGALELVSSQTCIVYMNGTTDYLEAFHYGVGTSANIVNPKFQAHLIVGA